MSQAHSSWQIDAVFAPPPPVSPWHIRGVTRSASDVANLEYKLKKRGFGRDPFPIECVVCSERAVFIYALKHTNLGGRSIEWCHHCQHIRAYTRDRDGDRVEESGFDLEQFVG